MNEKKDRRIMHSCHAWAARVVAFVYLPLLTGRGHGQDGGGVRDTARHRHGRAALDQRRAAPGLRRLGCWSARGAGRRHPVRSRRGVRGPPARAVAAPPLRGQPRAHVVVAGAGQRGRRGERGRGRQLRRGVRHDDRLRHLLLLAVPDAQLV
jgi:hypothetical protein